ncbi:DUF4174 domain-containing protein [Arenibacter sp. BSSL-BM3]|uniref:DUF4174 domain-containing protein n=1 Tax=Arenibacter arenosicollis TaxID=2762274 RepID=A0ABR7QQ70_9FLAO|nr:DUF4174 domain-containing protein [Arenibacter arenosicollis]MBC8769333.1 DUF4174 domain-containing protein [Arenibacter arenosicollis]
MRILLMTIGILMINHATSQDLKEHQWENRVVLIVSQNEDSMEFQHQIAEFNRLPKELMTRKMLIYEVLPGRYRIMNNQIKGKENEWITSTTLFDKFANKEEDFKVVLIGLDGGIKLEKTEVLTTTELFGTIDAMPMRRAEMKNKNR